jgi:alcohol dehydrogenase
MGPAVKAWRLSLSDGWFGWEDMPEPSIRPGAVLVRLEAASLVSYLGAYVSGQLPSYHGPRGTFTPGTNGVGVIEQVGAGVYGLRPGQRVLMTGYLTVAENVAEPAEALLSMTAEPVGEALLNDWPDGTLAELAVVPASTVTPIPADLQAVPGARLAVLSRCLVPYGGLLRARLAPGDTVIVNGATGSYGSAAVYVAVAMGAARVVAAGRNQEVLEQLPSPGCVTAVRLSGEVALDAAALREAVASGQAVTGGQPVTGGRTATGAIAGGRAGDGATGGADCALDMVRDADTPDATLATLAALRRGGRLVLMGSMSVPLPVDYTDLITSRREIIGNFMYPPDAPARLMQLAASGQLNLDRIDIACYPLADLPAAMDRAAERGAPLVTVAP